MIEKEALKLHKKLKGKIGVSAKRHIYGARDLSLLYTPGVAAVSSAIAKGKNVYDFTMKGNSVAIVTDGSRVLGLGNIGPFAALPVMEGKALLFKELAGIDAFPICLSTQKTSEIIRTVKNISPVFGGINLEDIETPKCFEIEKKLQKIGIPVMHDDQHGTAIAVLAGLMNAAIVAKKEFSGLKVVVNGAGAAGTAIAKLLSCTEQDNACQGVSEVIVCDSTGIISRNRKGLYGEKKKLSRATNPFNIEGGLKEALAGADAFIGVSVPNAIEPKHIRLMEKNPIVFALANPVPEIMPADALKAGAMVVATARSDFPNQVNNALAFPGVFRGALDARAKKITSLMKISAAKAIAEIVKKPSKNRILPSIFDKKVVKNVSAAVRQAVKEN